MNIKSAFPSKYIAAADLQGHDVPVCIQTVRMEAVEGKNGQRDELPIIYFHGKKKGMVLNVTNSNTISDMYGSETDNWANKWITLFPTTTEFGGKMVDCLRVRQTPPQQSAQAQSVRQVTSQSAMSPAIDDGAPIDDSLPPPSNDDYIPGVDDDIPF